MTSHIETARLTLNRFQMSDADDVFRCITPAITRFLSWDPPSAEDYRARCETLVGDDGRTELQFVIRRKDTVECLGVTAVERPQDELPELGIWMKAAAHGQGYGREAVQAMVQWASGTCDRAGFIYPVAVENVASRRIAEGLGGEVIGTRSGRKYESVVYRIPAST